LRETEIIRPRVQALKTHADTKVPYIFLAESTVNVGDTVARTGEITVEKPSLILPPHVPQFEGFEFDDEDGYDPDSFINFLLVRGIHIPSLRYNNTTSSLTVVEGGLDAAVKRHLAQLEQHENVQAGLLTGPEDCWQFSVIVYACTQIARNAEQDIRKLLADYHDKLS